MLRGGGRGVHVGRSGQALVQFAGTLRARAAHGPARRAPPRSPRARAGPLRRAATAARRAAAAARPVHLQHTHGVRHQLHAVHASHPSHPSHPYRSDRPTGPADDINSTRLGLREVNRESYKP